MTSPRRPYRRLRAPAYEPLAGQQVSALLEVEPPWFVLVPVWLIEERPSDAAMHLWVRLAQAAHEHSGFTGATDDWDFDRISAALGELLEIGAVSDVRDDGQLHLHTTCPLPAAWRRQWIPARPSDHPFGGAP